MRKETRNGILIILFYQIANRFINFTGFLEGIIQGFGFCLIIVGLLPDKAYEKLKGLKSLLIKSE